MEASEVLRSVADDSSVSADAHANDNAKERTFPLSLKHQNETAVVSEHNHPQAINEKDGSDGMVKENAANNSTLSASQTDTVVLLNNLDPHQRREYLRHQIEFYFSRENLAQDAFLVSQMDSDQYVAVELIASFNNVRRLVDDLPTLLEVIRESKQLQLDGSGTRVRPMFQRSIVVMREVARDVTEEQMTELFNGATAKAKNCPVCTSVEYADNGCWYVAFDTQNEAQKALEYIRAMKTFRGQPVMARLKAVPLARGALAFNRQFLASTTPQQSQHGGSLYQGSPNRISPMSGTSSIDISPQHFGALIPAATAGNISKSDPLLPDSLVGEQQQQQQQQQQVGPLSVRIMPTPTVPLVSTSAPPSSAHLPLLASPHNNQHQRQSVDITNDGTNTDYNKSRRKATASGYQHIQQSASAALQQQEFLAAVAAGQPFITDDAAAEAVQNATNDYYQQYQQQQLASANGALQWIPGFEHQHHYQTLQLNNAGHPSNSSQSSPVNNNKSDSQLQYGNVGGDGSVAQWSGGSNAKSMRRWQQQPPYQHQNNASSHVITPDDVDVAGFVPDVNYVGGDAAAAAAFIQHQYLSGNVQYEAAAPLLTLVAAAAAAANAAAEYPTTSSNSGHHQPDVHRQHQKCDVVFSSADDSHNSSNARVLSDASYFQSHSSSAPYVAYYQPQHYNAASDSMLLAAAAAGYAPNGAIIHHHQSGSPHLQQQHQQQWNMYEQQSSNNKRYHRSPTGNEMGEQRFDMVKSQQQQAAAATSARFNDNNYNPVNSSSSSTHNPGATQFQQPYSTSSLPGPNRRRSSYRNITTITMQHDSSISSQSPSSRFGNSSLPVGNRLTAHSGFVAAAASCGVPNCNHRSCNINRVPSPMRDTGDNYAAQYNFYEQRPQPPAATYSKIMQKTDYNDSAGKSHHRSADTVQKTHRDTASGSDYISNSTAYSGGPLPDYGYYRNHNKYSGQQHQYSSGGTDSAVSSLSSSNSMQPPPLSDTSSYVSLAERSSQPADGSTLVADQRNRPAAVPPRDTTYNRPVDRSDGIGRGRPDGLSVTNRRSTYDSKEPSFNDSQYAANRYQGGGAKSGSFSDSKRNPVNGAEASTSTRMSSMNSGAVPYVRSSPSSSNANMKLPSAQVTAVSNSGISTQQQNSARKPPVTASPRAAPYNQKMQRGGGNDVEFRQPSFELAGTAFPPLPTPEAFKSDAHQTTTETSSAADSAAGLLSTASAATEISSTTSGSLSDAAGHHPPVTNAWLQPKPDLRFHPPTAAHHHVAEHQQYNQRRQQQQQQQTNSAANHNLSSSCWNSSQNVQQQNSRYPAPFMPTPQQQQQRKPLINKVDKCIGTQDMQFMPRDMYTQLVKLVKMFKTNGTTTNIAGDVELTEQQQRQNDEMHRLLEELTLGGNVVLANEVKRRLMELNTVQKLSASLTQHHHHGDGPDKKASGGVDTKSVAAQTDKCSVAKNHVTSVLRQQSFTTEKGTSMDGAGGIGDDAQVDADSGASGDATTGTVTVDACC